jgi:ribosome-associated protein
MKNITIKTEYIKLNQLLKLAGYIGMGSDTKILVENGAVSLNGKKVSEIRKKIYPGDIVSVYDKEDIKVEGQE